MLETLAGSRSEEVVPARRAPEAPARPRLPVRGFFVGLASLIIASLLHAETGPHRGVFGDGSAVIYPWPTLALLLAIPVNRGLSRLLRRPLLSRGDLLMIYLMLLVTGAVQHWDFGSALLSFIPYPFWMFEQQPVWKEAFGQGLPTWLFVTDKPALSDFMAGNNSLWPDHWQAWVAPCLGWTCYIGALLGLMMCLANLVLRPWSREEHLAFPAVEFPLAISGAGVGPSVFNRLFWAGFAIPLVATAFAILHFIWPTVPAPPSLAGWNLGSYFASLGPPWSDITVFWVGGFWPMLMGVAFLVPLNILFSLWFFLFLGYGEYLAVRLLGFTAQTAGSFTSGQSVAAFLIVAMMLLWKLARARRLPEEAARTRSAALGAIAFLGLLVTFGAFVGMKPVHALAFFVLYGLGCLFIARVRAETGAVNFLTSLKPEVLLTGVFGARAFPAGSLIGMSVFSWMTWSQMGNATPIFLEGLQLGQRGGIGRRHASSAIYFAALIGFVLFFWGYVYLAYHYGQARQFAHFHSRASGMLAFGRLDTWLRADVAPSGPWPGYVTGAISALAMQVGRARLSWFPFTPTAYALAIDLPYVWFWFPGFVAWFAKLIVLRYGGLRMYRACLPLVFGLIAGDVAGGAANAVFRLLGGLRQSF